MARGVAAFLGEFVVPLVRGGGMHVGRPLSPEDLQRYEEELPHVSDHALEVDDARAEILAEVSVAPPPLVLGRDELSLAAAVHNLLFLAHPRAESLGVTSTRTKKVVDSARAYASRPKSRDRRRVLARHALLHNLFQVRRIDVTLTWWTGHATFRGQEPPSRLAAWKSLRRVREERSVASFDELLGTVEASPVVAAILRRSPLTHLLTRAKSAPPLHWEDAAFLLRDAELARALAYEALKPAEPRALVAAPSRYASAFEQMLERSPEEADVRAVAAFLVHLNALLAFGEHRERDESVKSPLLSAVLAPERAGQRPRGLAVFFALPGALAEVDPRLSEPPGMSSDRRLAARWLRYREQVAEALGDAFLDTLIARLRRHLRAGEAC
jgi:hypothetical protein